MSGSESETREPYADRWLAVRSRILNSPALMNPVHWLTGRKRVLAAAQAGTGIFWMLLFLFAPLLYIFTISFWQTGAAGTMVQEFTLENYYSVLLQDVSLTGFDVGNIYLLVLWQSLKFGIAVTAITLVLGYVPGYYLGRSDSRWLPVLLLLIILPFWVPLIVRYYAWMLVLGESGVLSWAIELLGFGSRNFLYNELAVISGLVQVLLPFMILPIYNSVSKIENSLIESAKTMGANPIRTFYEVSLPLSLPGVAAGCILVFILAVGSFLAPALLGGPGDQMIANLIERTFLQGQNWPLASAMSFVYLVVLFVMITAFNRFVSLDELFGEGS